MFNFSVVLVPLSIVKLRRPAGYGSYIDCRELYVFGIRLAYWTCG